MPSIRLPDGSVVNFPEGMDPEVARRLIVAQLAGKHGIKKEAATRGSDVLSSLTSGVANTLGVVPGIVGLLGGSYENAPLAGTVKSMREYAREKETPETTYKKYLIDQAIANASKQGGVSGEAIETLKQLAINPRVTGLKLLELIPDVLSSAGTGFVGSLAGKAAVKAFSKEAGEEAVKRGAQRGAVAGAVGTSAAQEGTSTGQEVYEETYRLLRAKEVPEEEARARAESAARGATVKQGLTVAALGKVLPGAEKALLGVGKGGVRRVAAGEAAEEGLTGISGQLTQNIAAGEIDPTIALSRGVGRAGTEGAVLGALAGAGAGAFSRRPTAPEAPPEDPAKAVTDTAVDSAVQRGDATVDEVEEADALARIAKIKSDAAAANVAAEEEKKAAAAVTPETEELPDVTQTAQAQQTKEEGPEALATDAATTATGVTPTEVKGARRTEPVITTNAPPEDPDTAWTPSVRLDYGDYDITGSGNETNYSFKSPQKVTDSASIDSLSMSRPGEVSFNVIPLNGKPSFRAGIYKDHIRLESKDVNGPLQDYNFDGKNRENVDRVFGPDLVDKLNAAKPEDRANIALNHLSAKLGFEGPGRFYEERDSFFSKGKTKSASKVEAPSGTVSEGLGVGVSVAGQPSGGTGAEGTGAPSTEGLGKTGDGVGEPAGGTAGEPAALTGKQPKKAKAVKEPPVEEGLTEEDLADEAAPVPRAYEKLDLADLEAKAAEVKAAPLAKAGEKISTRANLRTFDVNIPFDQARLEEKLAEVRKLPEKTLTKPQRAIRWYGAYVEANGGAIKNIPLYLAHNKADPALAATGLPKQYLQPAITWLNSNLGGTVGNNINAAAVGIRERLKKVESQRTESDSGAEKRKGGRRRKTVTEETSTEATLIDLELEEKLADLETIRRTTKDTEDIEKLQKEIADLRARKAALQEVSVSITPEARQIIKAAGSGVDVPYTARAFLQRMLTTKENRVLNYIAKRLISAEINPGITYGPVPDGRPAMFDPKEGPNGTITIDLNRILKDRYDHEFKDPEKLSKENKQAQREILNRLFRNIDQIAQHELAHAGIDHMIDNPKTLNDTQKTALAALKNLYDEVKATLGKEYDIGTLKEFAAEAMSNPDFQNALRKIESKNVDTGNFFSDFVRTIAGLFGLNLNSNAFARTLSELDKLISAPTKSRRGKEISYAPAEAKKIKIGNKEIEIQAKVTEPAVGTKKEKSDKQKAREALEAERLKNNIDLTMGKKDKVIRFAQNAQRQIVLLQEALRKKGVLSPDLALNDAITLQGSASDALARRTVDPIIHEYQNVLESISKKSNVDLNEVLAQMDRYYAAMTSVERRLSKFFERAKLSEAGDRRRDVLFRAIVADKAELAKIKKKVVADDVDLLSIIPDEMTTKDARALYKKIEEVVLTDEVGKLQDINSSAFQVAAIRTDDGSEIDLDVDLANQIIAETDAYLNKNPEIKKLYGQARTLQKDLETATLKLNRDANYGSPQLDMLMNARGWKNYVPLRGAPTKYQPEDIFERYEGEPSVTGLLVQTETKAKGRTTAAENSVFRSFAEATRAATRPARTEVTQIIKNLVEKGYIAGSINKSDKAREERGPSTFLERFIENKKLPREDNVVYHYGPDGKVDIIRINNTDLSRAIREVYQNSNSLIDRINAVTSFVGRGFTRYNPSFWAKNFVVDILTNSFVFAAEHGKASRYLWQVASDLVDNKGTAKGMNFIRLYEKGDQASRDAIEELAKKDSWYKDALDYVDAGGKVSYMSGLSTKKQQEATYDRLGPNKIVRTLKQFDSLITPITDGLELAARVSAFRTARTIPEFKDNERGAIAYVKNLANFENMGLQGKTFGALYMFFRPSATGAVRALDALMKGKHGKRTAILALSMGYFIASMSQLLSGDDEEGRNRVDTDDPDRWVRNWRIFIPGMENPIQIPWGFGMGTLASVGAQLWMFLHGRGDAFSTVKNVRTALFEGFLPVPFSQINFFEKPVQAFFDSIMPSVSRPLLQYAFNRDALDREIFNSTFSRYSPAYLSKENVPETINQFSRALYDTYTLGTGSPPSAEVEKIISPTGIGFFLNNYLSAVYKVGTAIDDTVRYTFFDGQKTPDPMKASMIFAGFKGTPANYDYQQFNELRKEVKGYESAIKTFERNKREDQLDAYLDKYPEREDAVKFLNKLENGKLRSLREEVNEISREYNDRPAERQELLKENRREQNAVMRDAVERVREILAR